MKERRLAFITAMGCLGIGIVFLQHLSNNVNQVKPSEVSIVYLTPSPIEQNVIIDYQAVRATQQYVLDNWPNQTVYLASQGFPENCFMSVIQLDYKYILWPDKDGGGSGNILDRVKVGEQTITLGLTARHVLDPSTEISELIVSRPIDPYDPNSIPIQSNDLHVVTFPGWDISVFGIRGDLNQISKFEVDIENVSFNESEMTNRGYAVGFPRGSFYSYLFEDFKDLQVFGAHGLESAVFISNDGQMIESSEASLNGASGSGLCTKEGKMIGVLSVGLTNNSNPQQDGNGFVPTWHMGEERFKQAVEEILYNLAD